MNNPTPPRAPELQAALDKLTEAFLRWPLPESVCADLCATIHGRKGRVGTNLLSFSEARQMFTDLLVPLVEAAGKCARAEKKWDELLARLDTAEEQVRTLRTALDLYRKAYTPDGHVRPHDCFATGPLTGDPIQDYIACPGCEAEAAYIAAQPSETKGAQS